MRNHRLPLLYQPWLGASLVTVPAPRLPPPIPVPRRLVSVRLRLHRVLMSFGVLVLVFLRLGGAVPRAAGKSFSIRVGRPAVFAASVVNRADGCGD